MNNKVMVILALILMLLTIPSINVNAQSAGQMQQGLVIVSSQPGTFLVNVTANSQMIFYRFILTTTNGNGAAFQTNFSVAKYAHLMVTVCNFPSQQCQTAILTALPQVQYPIVFEFQVTTPLNLRSEMK